MPRRQAIINLSEQALYYTFNVPEHLTIRTMFFEEQTMSLAVVVEGDALDLVPDGAVLPRLNSKWRVEDLNPIYLEVLNDLRAV